MPEVTNVLNGYREAARGLWNNSLRVGADFDRIDTFAGIREALFGELVLRPLGKSGYRKQNARDPYPFLRVVPTAEPVPIMISRPSADMNKYWDDPVNRIGIEGVRLDFVDYFDWNDRGFIDFQYYRVMIARFDKQPTHVGREALLDVHHALVHLDE